MSIKNKNFFNRQMDEIFVDPVLRFYGLALAIYLIFALYFMSKGILTELKPSSFPISWPFVSKWIEIRSNSFWSIYVFSAGIASIAAVAAFAFNSRLSYWLLLVVFFLKIFLGLQDYSQMGNYHYMPAIILFLFLFVPQKRLLLPLFLVSFYFFAGLLKLNLEWLTGQALARPLPQLLDIFGLWNYVFVVFLELVLSWLLLSESISLRVISFLALLFFHAVSWYWVGYFYPVTMFFLLSYFPLVWALDPHFKFTTEIPKLSSISIVALVTFFSAQMIPKIQPTDSALTGDGRLLSLNMYDAHSDCFDFAYAKSNKDIWEITAGVTRNALRVHCDPILYLDQINRICDEFKDLGVVAHVSYSQISKRRSNVVFYPTLKISHFCSDPIKFSIFGWNDWIESK